MKCLAKLAIILLTFLTSRSQEISFDVFSLVASQLAFLEDMCHNRTGDFTHFEVLKEAVVECQMEFLNGTSLWLTFKDLVSGDPREFYDFYAAQCSSSDAAQLRVQCNDKLKSLLIECLEETEIEAFNKMEDIAERLHNVICGIDEEKIKHFFSQKGQDCMVDNVITIGYCYLTAMPETNHEKQAMLFNLIEGHECNVIDDIENCTMPGIDACEDTTISSVFHLVFDFFRRELLCTEKATAAAAPEITHASDSPAARHVRVPVIVLMSLIVASTL